MTLHDLTYNPSTTSGHFRTLTEAPMEYRFMFVPNPPAWQYTRGSAIASGNRILSYETDNGGSFMFRTATGPISVPNFTTQATWRPGFGTGEAYYLGANSYALSTSATPASGSQPTTINPADFYRLRRDNNSAITPWGQLIEIGSSVSPDYVIISGDTMLGIFGGSSIQTGPDWVLERWTASQPPPSPTYTQVATWNSSGTSGASYSGDTGNNTANSLVVSVPAATGTFPPSAFAGSLWRFRRADNSAMTDAGYPRFLSTSSTQWRMRITSNVVMRTAFGTSNIQSGSGWILERQDKGIV